MIDRFLGDAFRGFVLPVSKYCSAVWCSAADTHRKLLDRVVSGASFLTVGVFLCDIAHRRSVVVLCMLYKIRYNPMHLLYGALLGRMCQCRLQAVLRSYIGILMRLLAAEPRSTAGLSVSLWNDHDDPIFNGVGLVGFKRRANDSLSAYLFAPFLFPTGLFFLFFHSFGWYCGAGVFGVIA